MSQSRTDVYSTPESCSGPRASGYRYRCSLYDCATRYPPFRASMSTAEHGPHSHHAYATPTTRAASHDLPQGEGHVDAVRLGRREGNVRKPQPYKEYGGQRLGAFWAAKLVAEHRPSEREQDEARDRHAREDANREAEIRRRHREAHRHALVVPRFLAIARMPVRDRLGCSGHRPVDRGDHPRQAEAEEDVDLHRAMDVNARTRDLGIGTIGLGLGSEVGARALGMRCTSTLNRPKCRVHARQATESLIELPNRARQATERC